MERISRSASIGGVLLSGFLLLAWPSGSPASGPSLACGTIHTVERGDTLDGIAERAYGGKGHLSREIFKVNADFLRDARRLEIGDQLLVPCLDGSGPQSRAAALEAAHATIVGDLIERPAGSVAPVQPAGYAESGSGILRMATSLGLAPFADFDAEAGGMVTDLLRRAMATGDDRRLVSVAFLEDADALAQALSADAIYDVSFPWVRPDCTLPAAPDAASRQRCETMAFSRGLVEVDFGYYTSFGSPLLQAGSDALAGRRICLPAASMIGGLVSAAQPAAHWRYAATPADCFDLLRAGEADAAMMTIEQAAGAISAPGYGEAVTEIAALRETRTLHAAARKGDADGEAALARIDLGLERIMLSGSWFEVVAAHRSRALAMQ